MPVDQALAAFAAQEFRFKVSTDTATRTAHPLSVEAEDETLLTDGAHAQSLADALRVFRGDSVARVRLRLIMDNVTIEPGQTVTMPNGALAFVEEVAHLRGDGIEQTELTLLVQR